MSIRRQGPVFDGPGMAAMIVAAGVILLGIIRLVARQPASAGVLLIGLALVAGAIFMLIRFRVPNMARVALIGAMIVILLAMVATGDFFGVRDSNDAVSNSMSTVKQPGISDQTESSIEPKKPIDAPASRGAGVHLEPDDAGDGGWADTINRALDGQLGGSGGTMFSIGGTVGLAGSATPATIAVTWSIASDQRSIRCGTTTILNADKAMAIDQIRASFRKAVDQSIASGAPACY